MITQERIRELITEHDERPNPQLGGLNSYATIMKIVLENEGIDLATWDHDRSKAERDAAFERAYALIGQVLEPPATA